MEDVHVSIDGNVQQRGVCYFLSYFHILNTLCLHSQERSRLERQLQTFQSTVSDLKATLATASADKERYFQEKLDLHQKLQNMTLEREVAQKEKMALEDQVQNADVA